LCLERATIAEWQGASEDQKFVAKPTQSNMILFFANGIISTFVYYPQQRRRKFAKNSQKSDET